MKPLCWFGRASSPRPAGSAKAGCELNASRSRWEVRRGPPHVATVKLLGCGGGDCGLLEADGLVWEEQGEARRRLPQRGRGVAGVGGPQLAGEGVEGFAAQRDKMGCRRPASCELIPSDQRLCGSALGPSWGRLKTLNLLVGSSRSQVRERIP